MYSLTASQSLASPEGALVQWSWLEVSPSEKTKRARTFWGWRSLFFFRSLARSLAGRFTDDPWEELESSRSKESMYETTAEASEVSGRSVWTFESQDMIEKRAPVRAFIMIATSLRTPSMRGLLPSQSSAAIEPVRSMTK